RGINRFGLTVASLTYGSLLKKLAKELGTSHEGSPVLQAEGWETLHLGMWSPKMRPPTPGDPPNTRTCGFASASALWTQPELDPEVDQFLESAPIVVAFGSACAQQAERKELLATLAYAAGDLGKKCLVIGFPPGTRFPENTL